MSCTNANFFSHLKRLNKMFLFPLSSGLFVRSKAIDNVYRSLITGNRISAEKYSDIADILCSVTSITSLRLKQINDVEENPFSRFEIKRSFDGVRHGFTGDLFSG